MKIYREKDLTKEFFETVEQAKILWREICRRNFEQYGDTGSCVAGAGISIQFLPPRCRRPKRKQIINQNDVSACQGSLNWEKGREMVLELFANAGIDVSYDWGRMD